MTFDPNSESQNNDPDDDLPEFPPFGADGKRTHEMMDEAADRAEAALQYLDTDAAKWEKFKEMLAEHQRLHREWGVSRLALGDVLSALYPTLSVGNYNRFGWEKVLRGSMTPVDFVQKLSLAQATGSTKGKL